MTADQPARTGEVMTVEALRERLAEHRFTMGGCSCGWRIARNVPMLPAFEEHQADVLLPVVREYAEAEKAAAWDEALRAVTRGVRSAMEAHRGRGHRQIVAALSGLVDAVPRTENPYRAALGDDREEGGR